MLPSRRSPFGGVRVTVTLTQEATQRRTRGLAALAGTPAPPDTQLSPSLARAPSPPSWRGRGGGQHVGLLRGGHEIMHMAPLPLPAVQPAPRTRRPRRPGLTAMRLPLGASDGISAADSRLLLSAPVSLWSPAPWGVNSTQRCCHAGSSQGNVARARPRPRVWMNE